MTDTLPTTLLTVNQTVTLTVQPDVAWLLTLLLVVGVVSVIHTLIDWKDEMLRTVKGWVTRG